MGAWCSCSSSQEIIIATPKGSPILRPSSGTFQFPPPISLPKRLTTILEDDEYEYEPNDSSQFTSTSNNGSNSTAQRKTRVKFVIPPPSNTQRSQNLSYQSHDWSHDECDPYEAAPAASLVRSSSSTRSNGGVANPQSLYECRRHAGNTVHDDDSDLVTMTLLDSSRVYTNGCGLPILIGQSGINAAKALQIHNFLYVMQRCL